MIFGLRVVNRAGGPPGYPIALARGALGAVGVMAAGLGLVPVLFDPPAAPSTTASSTRAW
jgi:uncharacterized RDD family membrane protein YckC